MEYLQGTQLESMIVPGGLPSETFFRCSLQIADALMHAQDRGIVHRDLKSANVIVGREGRVRVLDFGLSQGSLDVALALARVEAGKRGATSTRLRKLQSDAKGFAGFELDTGVALAEVEIASGQVAQGRARLATIEQQAKANGFLLTASQAAAAQR